MRQSPKSNLTARLRHDGRWFSTSVVGRYVGDRYEDERNTLPVDDYFVVDLRLSKPLSESTNLFLTVANLFDKAYEVQVNNNGFTEIGRPRFVGIGINFRR